MLLSDSDLYLFVRLFSEGISFRVFLVSARGVTAQFACS